MSTVPLNPAVIDVVEEAADGGQPEAEVVENRNGLWEIRAFPVREGGAVVLFSEVSLVRRSAEFRRRFVQDLSHELRSPLAVLRTTVEALEDDVDAAPVDGGRVRRRGPADLEYLGVRIRNRYVAACHRLGPYSRDRA